MRRLFPHTAPIKPGGLRHKREVSMTKGSILLEKLRNTFDDLPGQTFPTRFDLPKSDEREMIQQWVVNWLKRRGLELYDRS